MRKNMTGMLFRRPSLIVAAAVYLAALILILSGAGYYRYANEILEQQRDDILQRTVEAVVQEVEDALQEVVVTAQKIRSELRYVDMPAAPQLNAEKRIALHEASRRLGKLLDGMGSAVQTAYLYSNESGYAVFTNAVLAREEMGKYFLNGFSAAELDALHAAFSRGRLVVSENGLQTAYVLSVGRSGEDQAQKQIVLLLRSGFFARLVSAAEAPNAVYTLRGAEGELLNQMAIGAAQGLEREYSYHLKNGCTLTAAFQDMGDAQLDKARGIYLLTVAAGLTLVTLVTVCACHLSDVPTNQLIEYLESQGKKKISERGMLAIRNAVDDIMQEQAEARQKLEELRYAQRSYELTDWLRGRGSRSDAWRSANYVLVLLTPEARWETLHAAMDGMAFEGEYALLSVHEGQGLLLGLWNEPISEQQGLMLAERLLAVMDDEYSCALRAAVSAAHGDIDALAVAYREARMALDVLILNPETLCAAYSTCDFGLGTMAYDGEYPLKQQRFHRLIATGSYAQAAEYLEALAGEHYLSGELAGSEIERLHLETMKFQMILCANCLWTGSEDAMVIRQECIRAVMMCADHQELVNFMRGQLLEADASEAQPSDSAVDETVEQAKRFVRQHYGDPQLTVTSLAEEMQISPNALSKLFSRKANIGVLQYIHKIRIEAACNLMLSTNLPLTEICPQVGYASPLTFSRAFKARYHMTPSAWREMNDGAAE